MAEINHAELNVALSETVIELNDQRRDLLDALKKIKAEAYGQKQWAFIVDCATRAIDKCEKLARVAQ